LFPLIRDIIVANKLSGATYVEPFAGGAGLALKLLTEGVVSRIIINDLDAHIFSFWHSVLNESEALCDMIRRTPVNRKHWRLQRAIYQQANSVDLLSLGFATFFLNRTNVSGVLAGGMIGGKRQDGNYKLDARFDKKSLIGKVRSIAQLRQHILLFNDDAIDFLKRAEITTLKKALINFDPPYVQKGAALYKNSFTETDHRCLAKAILACRKKWIVTYDVCPLVTELFKSRRMGHIGVYYSARNPRLANECIIFNNNVRLPNGSTILATANESGGVPACLNHSRNGIMFP
jgi:DNA adenine methylase